MAIALAELEATMESIPSIGDRVKQESKALSVKVPLDLATKLEDTAHVNGTTVSNVVRSALSKYLEPEVVRPALPKKWWQKKSAERL